MPNSWVHLNTNAALRSTADINIAIRLATAHSYPLHPDYPKSWDVFLAIEHTLLNTSAANSILDAGGDLVSTYLPTLRQLGYEDLSSLNLLHEDTLRTEYTDGIYYQRGDIEDTGFNVAFSFIACLSVIEHGVDVAKFLAEASRILKPNGHLFISTDFWETAIDTGISDWKIFVPEEIRRLIADAAKNDLLLTSPLSLRCGDRVVKHAGAEYTFLSLLFRKVGCFWFPSS